MWNVLGSTGIGGSRRPRVYAALTGYSVGLRGAERGNMESQECEEREERERESGILLAALGSQSALSSILHRA